MHYDHNHIFCLNSNWDDGMFDTEYAVHIKKWPHWDVKLPITEQVVEEDWKNLIEDTRIPDLERFEETKKSYEELGFQIELKKEDFMKSCPTPLPHVMDWLKNNVKPMKKTYNKNNAGWCIGNDEYRSSDIMGIGFWFERKRDAMSFIKSLSVRKKPLTYWDSFEEDRRELIDGKLVKVDSFSK